MPQVFISFRGRDERQKLVPHLIHHLRCNNVKVVTDADATGEPMENLFEYIRNSRIVIVIFSINFLESKCCLDELLEIKKCIEMKKLMSVIPIFYKVKASHVKTQTGDFGKRLLDLKKKHPLKCINEWKQALEVVTKHIGLTYEKKSLFSELDFVKKIVEKVRTILANNQETTTKTKILQGQSSNLSDVNDLIKLLYSSKTLEGLDLERSFRQGLMISYAWNNLISSMRSSNNSFKISSPRKNSNILEKESVEKAANWLTLQMMIEQTQPALIFTNWDHIDQDTKSNILYSARKKTQMISRMLKGCNMPSYGNSPSFVEVRTWVQTMDRMSKPKAPQDWHRPELRRSISYRDNRDRCYPLPYEMYLGQNPVETRRTIDNIILGKHHHGERGDDMSCFSLLRYLLIRFCLSFT